MIGRLRRKGADPGAGPRPLTTLAPGESGTIARVAAGDPGRLVKLSSLGIMPGVRLTLVQRRPAVVVTISETSIALDPSVAEEILIEGAGPAGAGRG